MHNIIKTWNGKTIRFREDGYGCLTDMAKANGRLVADWQRLSSTTEYLQALEANMGNPINELVQSRVGGNIPEEERGTWAERKVCIRFAQWCSPEFAVQVDIWVEELMTAGVVSIKDNTTQVRDNLEKQFVPKVTLKEIDQFARIMGKRFGASYEQRLLTQNIKKFHPHLAIIETKPEEVASVSEGEVLLTPIQIADRLGVKYKSGKPDPKTINKLLEQLGYQERIADMWSATSKAKGLCDRKPVETNGKSHRDQLLWKLPIVDILKEHLVNTL